MDPTCVTVMGTVQILMVHTSAIVMWVTMEMDTTAPVSNNYFMAGCTKKILSIWWMNYLIE